MVLRQIEWVPRWGNKFFSRKGDKKVGITRNGEPGERSVESENRRFLSFYILTALTEIPARQAVGLRAPLFEGFPVSRPEQVFWASQWKPTNIRFGVIFPWCGLSRKRDFALLNRPTSFAGKK